MGCIHFETKNLIVRDLDMSDKEEILLLYSDPNVFKLDNSQTLNSLEEAEQFIVYLLNPYLIQNQKRWGIVDKATNSLIGTCGFRNWDKESNHAEIGGNIISDQWGKGYAKELIPNLIHYGFTQMKLNKIYANTFADHERVLRLLASFDFKKEGLLREAYRLNGEYKDILIYSILKKEYDPIMNDPSTDTG